MEIADLKVGMSVWAQIPESSDPRKIHITHVLQSHYDRKLIVYKFFGIRKRWWHEFMQTDDQLIFYINLYEKNKQYWTDLAAKRKLNKKILA